MEELTEHQRAILDFEARMFSGAGSKERAIRDEFDLSATRYYQQLNALLDTQAALAHNPLLVNRLLRLRAARRRSRTDHRVGPISPPGV